MGFATTNVVVQFNPPFNVPLTYTLLQQRVGRVSMSVTGWVLQAGVLSTFPSLTLVGLPNYQQHPFTICKATHGDLVERAWYLSTTYQDPTMGSTGAVCLTVDQALNTVQLLAGGAPQFFPTGIPVMQPVNLPSSVAFALTVYESWDDSILGRNAPPADGDKYIDPVTAQYWRMKKKDRRAHKMVLDSLSITAYLRRLQESPQ